MKKARKTSRVSQEVSVCKTDCHLLDHDNDSTCCDASRNWQLWSHRFMKITSLLATQHVNECQLNRHALVSSWYERSNGVERRGSVIKIGMYLSFRDYYRPLCDFKYQSLWDCHENCLDNHHGRFSTHPARIREGRIRNMESMKQMSRVERSMHLSDYNAGWSCRQCKRRCRFPIPTNSETSICGSTQNHCVDIIQTLDSHVEYRFALSQRDCWSVRLQHTQCWPYHQWWTQRLNLTTSSSRENTDPPDHDKDSARKNSDGELKRQIPIICAATAHTLLSIPATSPCMSWAASQSSKSILSRDARLSVEISNPCDDTRAHTIRAKSKTKGTQRVHTLRE